MTAAGRGRRNERTLTDLDARAYRCPGCGEWHLQRLPGENLTAGNARTCPVCRAPQGGRTA